MEDIKVLIIGSDANAYFMARCAHELLNKKIDVYAKSPLSFTKYSKILNIKYFDKLWEEKSFVKIVNDYANKNSNYKILLVSTNETYTQFIAQNSNKLSKNLYFNKQDPNQIKTITNKESFYETYKNHDINFPKTKYYDCKNNEKIPKFKFPMILKPSNVVEYNHISFEDKHKIYKIESQEELIQTIKTIKLAGYKDKLILQEFIPGDDSHLFDVVIYSNRNYKVNMISFAQIGLQERTKEMVGNAACLINGFSTFKNAPINETKEQIIKFIENIKYTGFAEFDLKYDERDNKFKVFEINARQGRCSYYVSACGANLIETMINDLIYKKDTQLRNLTKEQLLSFVPKKIIKKYIDNTEFKKKALTLWKHRCSPMQYNKDKDIKRYLMIKRRLHNYSEEYKNAYWKS